MVVVLVVAAIVVVVVALVVVVVVVEVVVGGMGIVVGQRAGVAKWSSLGTGHSQNLHNWLAIPKQ